jgi:hypothetical protein
MPFIYTTNPKKLFFHMTNDKLLDVLQDMGQHGKKDRPPPVVRAAFRAASSRRLITPAEADAGIKEVLGC